MTQRVLEFLGERASYLILTHVDPDGDGLGAALGLQGLLRGLGRTASVHVADDVPRMYRFLPGADEVRTGAEAPAGDADAAIVLDATSPQRLGPLAAALAPGLPVLNIDHHPDNTRFGDLAWVDPTAAATALLIHELARGGGLEIGPDIAVSLYVGILTDTGRFTFANTDERALRAAAELVSLGANPRDVAARVYERKSEASVRLLGMALRTLELRDDGRIACLHVTRDMLTATGASAEDAEGFATYARSIAGVRVGLFLRETAEGHVKISLRSNGGVPIDGVAGQFGGGGHPSASGARVPGPLAEAKEAVLGAVSRYLETRG